MARSSDIRNCYVYFGEVDGVVRYVGQGRKGRIGRHLREMRRPENLRRKLYVNLIEAVERGADIKFYKVAENLSAEESQALELEEIAKRREQLWNMKPGRRPKITDEELIKKLSAAHKVQWTDPAYRAKMEVALSSAERRAKISEAVTGHMAADPQRRERLAAARRADWKDPAYREKMIAAIRRGKLGKPWTVEQRQKLDAIHRDPEYLERLSAAHKKAK